MEISEKNILFTSSIEIKEILQPFLKHYNLNYFNYMRIYSDSSIATLSTNPVRDKYLLERDYKDSMDYDPSLYTKEKGCILWTDGEKFLHSQTQKELIRKKIIEGSNYFNTGNGIAFFEKHNDYLDCYQFATYPQNDTIIPLYFNHYDCFDLFIAYFKENANSLIKLSHKDRIFLPSLNGPQKNKKIITPECIQKEKFLKSFRVKKYYLQAGGDTYLTARELACLSGIARGLKQKEVAKHLKVSPRTVEYFLENLKRKFNLNSISSLAEAYWKSLLPKHIIFDSDI